MPFIHVRAYTGRDLETKQRAAEAIAQAAAEVFAAPLSAFTIVFEDIDQDKWETEVNQAIIEPLRDLMIMDHGDLL